VKAVVGHLPRIHHAWWVAIVGCLVLFFQQGVGTYVLGVLQTAWVNEFGWPRTWISLVYTGGSLLPGLTGVIVGRWCDRFGTRWVIISGAAIISIAYVLFIFTNTFAYFALIFSLSFIGRALASNVAVNSAITQWFAARRSLAIGIASTGASLAGVVLVPLATYLVLSNGWRSAAATLGILAGVITIPLAWVIMRGKPADWGLTRYGEGRVEVSRRFAKPDATLESAIRGPSFWLLAIATVLGSAGLNSLGIHMLPAVIDKGVSPATGAAVISAMTGTAIIAKLILGWLGDRLPSPQLFAATFLFQTVGYFLLVLAGPGIELWMFAIVYGIGFGGAVALQPVVVADLFGVSAYGAILGAIALPNSLVAAISPVYSAAIRDSTGSYGPAFATFGICAALGAVAVIVALGSLRRAVQPVPAA
jgi:MFS family permease